MKTSLKSGLVLMAVLVLKSSVTVTAAEDTNVPRTENIPVIEQYKEDIGGDNGTGYDLPYQEGWNGTIDGENRCYVDSQGNKLVGLNSIEGKWYYFDQNGYLLTGWQTIDNSTYYFSPETGERYESGSYVINDQEYTFDENGVLVPLSEGETEEKDPNDQEETESPPESSIGGGESDQNSPPGQSNDSHPANSGWQLEDEGWYYYDSSGNRVTGWLQLGSSWYYLDGSNSDYPGLMLVDCKKEIYGHTYFFSSDGSMQTGMIKRPEGIYYAHAGGYQVFGWQQFENKWYYFDENNVDYPGLMVIDSKKEINGRTYFFNKDGIMQTGWVKEPEGWYYTDINGAKKTGWIQLGKNWYYLDGANNEYPGLLVTDPKKEINGYTYFFEGGGVMQTGWVRLPEGWYYAHAGGNQITGWLQLGKNWYYLDVTNNEYPGLMVTGPKKEINNHTYFFEGGGVMQTGWVRLPEGWYYAHAGGNQITGWLLLGKNWYYLDVTNSEYPGLMVTDPKKEINGYTYFFEGGGVMQTGWVRLPEGWYYAHSGGNQEFGWLQLPSGRYYLDAGNVEYPGLMVSACTMEIDGHEYIFLSDGRVFTGWKYIKGEGYYYYDNTGLLASGWKWVNNKWYYLDPQNNNIMVSQQWKRINGYWYYFRADGDMALNWIYIGGNYYYLSSDGVMRTGWQQINGDWYYFYKENDPNGGGWGVMARNTTIDGYRLQANGAMVTTEEYKMSARAQSYSSSTGYLILVDRSACKVGIFTGGKGAWNMLYFWDCAPGKASTPTVSGVFTVQAKGYYFDSGSSRCYWYTQFYGNYLFHSVLYSKYTGDLVDGRVGIPLSHGCVRLVIDNAKWIYDNIPRGTKVVIY